ncbi:MAG TPA: recombination protein RecR, partial [Erysipelothrix sp.]|nr:recombination protein RecR [Erysipelothrix sp.]
KYCERCGNFSSDNLCEICQDEHRDQETLCVVGSIKDIVAIERLEQYPGTYFVLNGLISTVENILPVDLNINQLQHRLDEGVKEMILALNPTVEGETTALYLAKKFSNQCEITRLAQGLPMGGQLEYVDDLTLLRSMLNRKILE